MKKILVFAATFLLAFSPAVVSYAQATDSDVEIIGSVSEEETSTGEAETEEDEAVIKIIDENGEITEIDLDDDGTKTDEDASGDTTTTGVLPESGAEINADDNVKVEVGDVPYLALGADLSAEQKQTVLNLMGIGDADISGYDIVTVTNEEEHKYLDAYIDSATIGTRALSSVLIMQDEPGSGISVSTKNINYCTVGMYRNALATAGLTDAKVIVAGPFELSGTAALIGAMKAYSEMTGESVDTTALDIALDELVLTGSVREKYNALSGGEAEELIAYLKGVVLSENLDTDQIKKLIIDGADQYGVSLSDEEINEICGFLDKLKDIDIDTDEILGYAEDLYDKFKDVKIDEETQNFFLKIINAIIEFFKKLFGAA